MDTERSESRDDPAQPRGSGSSNDIGESHFRGKKSREGGKDSSLASLLKIVPN